MADDPKAPPAARAPAAVPNAHHLLFSDAEVRLLYNAMGSWFNGAIGKVEHALAFAHLAHQQALAMGNVAIIDLLRKLDLHFLAAECMDPECDAHHPKPGAPT